VTLLLALWPVWVLLAGTLAAGWLAGWIIDAYLSLRDLTRRP
jgi:hypothetical protein